MTDAENAENAENEESGESGGVRALRAWATAATKRALRLCASGPAVTADPHVYDSSVAELEELVRLLAHDAEPRATLTVQLGSVLTMRYLARGGPAPDRDRARRLLREARDPSTATGAATDADDRRWAALFLLSLTMPAPLAGAGAAQADFSAALDWRAYEEPGEMAAIAAEMPVLVAEALELPLAPELHGRLRQMSTMFAALSGPDGAGALRRFVDSLPDGFPGVEQLRLMADVTATAAGPGPVRVDDPGRPDPAAPPRPSGSREGRPPRTSVADADGPDVASADADGPDAVAADANEPDAAASNADGPDVVAADAMMPSLFDALEAVRGNDPEAVNRGLRRLRAVHEQLPPGQEASVFVENFMGVLLQSGAAVGGNLRDQSLGHEYVTALADRMQEFAAESTTAVTAEFAVAVRVQPLMSRIDAAYKAEDAATVRALLGELEALEADTPPDNGWRFQLLLALAQGCLCLGNLTNGPDLRLRAAAYYEQSVAAAEHAPAIVRESLSRHAAAFDAVRARVTGDPATLRPATAVPPDAPTHQRWDSAQSLMVRYTLTRDLPDLDALITELRRVCDDVRQGRGTQFAARAQWMTAEAYRARWQHMRDPADRVSATATAKEALNTLAADVFLQLGSEDGVLTARSGAARSVTAATWAASHNQAEEAVAALELGRALVLHAASTSRTVPELLDARGQRELAEAWRKAGADGTGEPDGPPGELPSTLRRRALEALGYRRHGLFRTPTLNELADGVAEGGADALVYLLPGEGDAPGVGIVVGADFGVGIGGLPLLSGTGSGPLERYLDAAAARSSRLGEPDAERAWEEALSALCDWAYPAALDDILTAVTRHLAADGGRRAGRSGPPRIVLVPCGRLGVVPWHAARLPAAAPHDYVCQIAVISYAASGGEFLRTVKRTRPDPAGAAVLIADPRQELTHAEREATALREAFYPQARLYGEFYDPPVEPVAAGTPDEVLALLSEAPSLLHVASHGSAGVRPTASALHLAFPDGADTLPAEEGGPGAEPDLGMLTVTRLLDRPWHETPSTQGPLVVLSACETDLSTRDHDEALTLTTAFVSGGARNVVGSRWTAQDGASALMMAVFHHYLTVEGQAPADALRAAQLWMLDPHREDPGSLTGELLREIRRPGLERLPVWAAFIHQGHPGPARTAPTTAHPAPTGRPG
ncbi:CHAT domain-containing protein [Streptomyces sp. NPDC012751]|uniref:CHAT domain-containing protein n=1 Tax=Streptomyces sp. NPDC012751 TaxID=3364846 RepID=UPI0036BFDF9A